MDVGEAAFGYVLAGEGYCGEADVNHGDVSFAGESRDMQADVAGAAANIEGFVGWLYL